MYRDQPNTLIINRSDSRCGRCRKGARPEEPRHITEIGYASHLPGPGCGEEFKYVTSHYAGMKKTVTAMRPDLEWVSQGWD